MTIESKPPIFVTGPPRSGTTLMGQILARHPCVASPGESHFFEDVWSRRAEIGSLETDEALDRAVDRTLSLFGRYNFPDTQNAVSRGIDADVLKRRVRNDGPSYATLYSAFMEMVAGLSGEHLFCDDTPKHLFYLDEILGAFPEARVICMIRDPRDFLASYKNYWRRSTESDRVRKLYHPILTTMLWRGSANMVRHYADHPRVKLVRYEDLVTNPEHEVRSILSFLGLEYSAGLLEVDADNSSYGGQRTGINRESVGRWRDNLDDDEVWWHQYTAGSVMSSLGYSKTPVIPPIASSLKVLFSTPGAVLRAVRANSRKRGPLLGYVLRRAIAMAPRRRSKWPDLRPEKAHARD